MIVGGEKFVNLVRWRLVYGDGRVLDERPGGSSIIESWPGPKELQIRLISDDRVWWTIPIPPGATPIWCRKRSCALDGTDQRLDAVICGVAFDRLTKVECKLFAFVNGELINCPQEWIPMGAVQLQVEAFSGRML